MKRTEIGLGSVVTLKIDPEMIGMVVSETRHLGGGMTLTVQWSPDISSAHHPQELELTDITRHRLGITQN